MVLELGKYFILELECMGNDFQEKMKKNDSQLSEAIQSNKESEVKA